MTTGTVISRPTLGAICNVSTPRDGSQPPLHADISIIFDVVFYTLLKNCCLAVRLAVVTRVMDSVPR